MCVTLVQGTRLAMAQSVLMSLRILQPVMKDVLTDYDNESTQHKSSPLGKLMQRMELFYILHHVNNETASLCRLAVWNAVAIE